jgi:HPr kinase/phosphorylase
MEKQPTVRGVLVLVQGVGVLMRGPSGSGKSMTALNLMRRGHLLVSDELVDVFPGSTGELWGKPLERNVRIEVRGLGIFSAESLFPGGTAPSSRIDLVVDLDGYDSAKDTGRTAPDIARTRILGHELAAVRLPLPSGADGALMIELLARLHTGPGLVHT